MSNVLKNVVPISSVSIGDKHFDFDKEAMAEQNLAQLCPTAAVQTDPDGSKLIPIMEVFKIKESYDQANQQKYQEGFQAGHADGLKQGLAEAEKVLQNFNQAIHQAISQREAILNEARQRVLDLVIKVSRKVTFDAIEVDPERTLEMINGVIDTLVDRSSLKIKVNPDHLPIVEQNISRFLKGSTTIKEIKIEPDPRVKFGGCFIETPTGDIDARLESQFAVVEEAILTDQTKE